MLPKLTTIALKNGQQIDVSDGVTVLVGPNNAGKSRLLREAIERLQQPVGNMFPGHLVVESMTLQWPGTQAEFLEWIDEVYGWRPPGQYPEAQTTERTARVANGLLHESQAAGAWGISSTVGPLFGIYALQLDAQSRLGVALDGSAYNTRVQPPTTPPQHLFNSRELESQISSLMKRAFGDDLTVDRYAGGEIPLLVGRPTAEETKPPPSIAYRDELAALPRLSDQGDGMRAFMGMLLTIRTTKYGIIFIDEPEAFLHPPQARLLGRILAEEHAQGTQVIVATHSEDIVQGATGAAPPAGYDPTIVRISRRDSQFSVSQIPVAKVQQLYHDPLLRHSSVLSGLFYQGVAVCEGDSDCIYFQAVLGHLIEIDKAETRDIHFMHCGGKARIWKAVDALRAASVPAVAIVDFDILRSKDDLNRLASACGGDITELTADLNVLHNTIKSKTKPANKLAARTQILAILDQTNNSEVTKNDREGIAKALSGVDGWRDAKQNGSRTLPADALNAFMRIDEWMRQHKIFITPGGELESFNRATPSGDKATWLATVLEGKLFQGDTEAHEFIAAVSRVLAEP